MKSVEKTTDSSRESIRFGKDVNNKTEVTLPTVEVLTGRAFLTGKSGSGKSNSASVIAEKLLDRDFPLLIVDTDGEYYGLKEKYDVLHVGAGDECDRQVTSDHAPKLAELALEDNVPIILDVSGFLEESDGDDLIRETTRELFKLEGKMKKPFLILVEEIHEYIPENGGIGDTGKMLIRIAKRGRKRGLGIAGMSQRPADVKKDFITQCDWVLWHRLTWKNDTDVVGNILGKEYAQSVQELDDGEGFLVADFLDADVKRVQVHRKQTFDAGATPDLDSFDDEGSSEMLEESVDEQISEKQGSSVKALEEYDDVVGASTESTDSTVTESTDLSEPEVSAEQFFDDSSLLVQFTNVREGLSNRVVAKVSSDKFHMRELGADGVKPACSAKSRYADWDYVEVDQARLAGLDPCRSCFGPVLQHLAQDTESEVGLRDGNELGDVDMETNGDLFEPEPIPERPQLATMTDDVIIRGGQARVMNAPTQTGTLCGERGRYREVNRTAVESHYNPCKRCFDVDALES